MRWIGLVGIVAFACGVVWGGLVPNGSFKDGFHYEQDVGGYVGNYWDGYNIVGHPSFEHDPRESMDGDSQRIWSDYVAFRSGIMQVLTGKTPGQYYTLKAWVATTWTGASRDTFEIGKKVGIDPYGGTDPQADSVVWGCEYWQDNIWHELSVSAQAQSSNITIFVEINCPVARPAAQTWIDCVTIEEATGVLIIGAPEVIDLKGEYATVRWYTNLPSSSRIEYGTTLDYGESTPYYGDYVTEHVVTIEGLTPGTTYHYKVISTAYGYGEVVSDDSMFTTYEIEITGGPTATPNATGASIVWSTNIEATSQVEYGLTTDYGNLTPIDETLTTSHNVVLTGLTPETTYHYRVRSAKQDYGEAVSEDHTFTTPALTITSGPNAVDVSQTGATIVWQTNGEATSQVEYGLTEDYGQMTPLDENMVTEHSVVLTGLQPNTTYHYRVISTVPDYPPVVSGDRTFFTALSATSPQGWLREGWNLISLPLEPVDPLPTEVFSDLIALGNVIQNNLYKYTRRGYEVYPGDFNFVCTGEGYWLLLSVGGQNTIYGEEYTQDYQLYLISGWNLVGHPFPQEVAWADCTVDYNGQVYTLQEAANMGLIQGTAYYFDNGYKIVALPGGGGDDTFLRPWRGYWVYAGEAGVSLIIPAP